MHSATLDFTPGVPFHVEITFQHPDGTSLDLSGCDIRMQIRKTINTPAIAELMLGDEITLVEINTIALSLSALRTAAISTSGLYDIAIAFPDGKVIYYPNEPGSFRLVRRVTV